MCVFDGRVCLCGGGGQDVLSELQLVCRCVEVVSVSEESGPAVEPSAKRKRDEGDAEPPSKRLLGDGTRPAGAPVRWQSPDTAITIRCHKHTALRLL